MTATAPAPELPRWDLTPFFPSIESREFGVLTEEVASEVGRLQRRFDDLGIRGGDPLEVDDDVVAAADEVVDAFNRLLTNMRRIGSYLYGHTTTDATDAAAAGALSRYQASVAPFATLDSRFDAWLARLPLAELVERSPLAADHAYALERGAIAAKHQMGEAEEDLAAELSLTGGRAWAKLHADLTARLTATVDGEVLPIGSTGDVVPRNAMALANVAYMPTYTWANPLLTNLERQIPVPMFGEAPVELGITGNESKVLARFKADRDDAYEEFIDKCDDFEREVAKEITAGHYSYAELEENDVDLKKLQGWLEKIAKLDFYGAARAKEARTRLQGCEAVLDDYAKRVFDAKGENG